MRQLSGLFQLVATGVPAALVTRNGTTLGGIVLSAGRFAHAGSRTYYADRLSRVYAPGVDKATGHMERCSRFVPCRSRCSYRDAYTNS